MAWPESELHDVITTRFLLHPDSILRSQALCGSNWYRVGGGGVASEAIPSWKDYSIIDIFKIASNCDIKGTFKVGFTIILSLTWLKIIILMPNLTAWSQGDRLSSQFPQYMEGKWQQQFHPLYSCMKPYTCFPPRHLSKLQLCLNPSDWLKPIRIQANSIHMVSKGNVLLSYTKRRDGYWTVW